MKKFLKIFGITILAIFLLLLLLPLLFKGKIIEEIKVAANENLTAKVDFTDVSLSLITNFPNLSVDIDDLTVTGTEQFEGVKLADIQKFSATVDVWSLFGDRIEIVEIGIMEPKIHILVLENGAANYDIAKPSDEVEDTTAVAEEEAGMELALKNYFLQNGHIIYDDRSIPYFMDLKNLNHEGSGNFAEEVFTLMTQTHADEVNVIYDDVKYVNHATVDIDADIDMNFAEMKFTFNENEIKLNELVLGADGWLAMPADDIDMDITFKAKETEFRNLLSMVPAEFASDLEGVDVTGTMAFDGYVKGTYNDNSMPGFGVNLMVENGRFQYPDLPKAAENIQVKASIDAPDGNDYDKMKIDVPQFHVELGGNPIDATLKLRTPMSDPQIDTDIQAKVILATLKDVIPMEETDNLNGTINADVHLHGRMSTIEQGQYEQFEANGQIILQEIAYSSTDLPYDVNLDVAYFNFSPQYVELSQFKSRIADSDISANGKITNYLAYALKDSLLTGNFTVNSNLLNLNPFMTSEEAVEGTEEAPADTTAMSVLEVPANIDFTLNANFNKVIYQDVNIDNMKGLIEVKDKKAILSNLGMNVLGGQVNMSGVYDTQNPVRPTVDFKYDINSMSIQETATTFNTVEKLAPIAKNCTGKYSTDLTFKAVLDTTMSPIPESIEGRGTLETESVFIEGFAPLNKLAEKLKIDRLSKQNIQDVSLTYTIENGKVMVDPFTVELEGMEATISGYTTVVEQNIDYQVAMEVPYEKLGDQAGQQASDLLGQINDKLGTNLSAGQTIPVKVNIVGTVTDPQLQLNFGDIGGSVKDIKEEVKEQVKEKVEEKVEEVKEDAIAKAREEADKILAEAQKRADQVVAEAKKAAKKVKDEGYAQAQNLEDEAKNPLQKAGAKVAADKLRKETDKKAEQIVSEAKKQADKIMAEAQERADQVIENAENK